MTGSIIKRGDQTYLLRLSLGKDVVTRKRLYRTETVHGTRKEAEARLRKLVGEYESGTLTKATSQSLNEFLAEWLKTAAGRLRERTLKDYEGICRYYLLEDLGRLPLSKVSALDIQQSYNRLTSRGLSPLSIKKIHVVLNGALKQAVKWRVIPHNPAVDVDLPKVTQRKIVRSLTLEQAQQLLAACQGHRLQAYFHFALQTGARPEEILGLLWEDIDFDRGLCRIEKVLVRPTGGAWRFQDTKTAGSRRTLQLGSGLMLELKRHRRAQELEREVAGSEWKAGPSLIFASSTGTPLFRTHFVKRVYKPLLKKAGLPTSFRLRDLRHTCATLLLEAGENIKAVSDRLGHGDVRLTLNIYAHCLPAMEQSAARLAGELFQVGPPRVKLQGWASSRYHSSDHLVITDTTKTERHAETLKAQKTP